MEHFRYPLIRVSCSYLNILCYGIYLSRKCTVSRKDYPVVSTFMIYHRICNKIITTSAIHVVLSTFSFGAHEFTLGLCRICVAQPLVLFIAFCSSLLVLFRLFTVLYVLPCNQCFFFWLPLCYLQKLVRLTAMSPFNLHKVVLFYLFAQ